MATEPERIESTTLSPDDAFEVLGDETRLQILRALGEADGPLAFSEVFEEIEYDDYSNFGYHLERLVGHFVRKDEAGYELKRPGKRVVEAVLAGIVTDNPVIERTGTEWSCLFCGEDTEMSYREGGVVLYCSACEGLMSESRAGAMQRVLGDDADDIVGYVGLPPAGVYDRRPTAVLESAEIWTVTQIHQLTRGVCPRCSAPVERSVRACEAHAPGDGVCDSCDHRFGVTGSVSCTNCIFEADAPFATFALGNVQLMGFMIDYGIDPMAPEAFHKRASEEEIRSTDPLDARYTFTAGGESLTLRVEDGPTVTDVTRSRATDPR